MHGRVNRGNDFVCFDYRIIEALNSKAKYLILHSVYNTETGGYIGDGQYLVINLSDYDGEGWSFADGYDDVRHSKRGWNQDEWYFGRCVALSLKEAYGEVVPRFSERQKRFGGKRIDEYLRHGSWSRRLPMEKQAGMLTPTTP
jgi:hypothetical protein